MFAPAPACRPSIGSEIRPATCRPITTSTAPPSWRSRLTWSRRAYPTRPMEAHRATKTTVKPSTNASD